MTSISFQNITKHYGKAVALNDVSFTVQQGEFCSLVGPSGCGKTTLLRIAAGFTLPDQGAVLFNNQPVDSLPPNRRNVGFVFQSYALFPTKTVQQNIGFSLALKRISKEDITNRVHELCELMGLENLMERYPHEISGGQQQRVALARALANNPSILLLDEPLSALDAKIRTLLRQEIRRIADVLGITAIYVTHDQEEALSISDRVAVMDSGSIVQAGSPFEVYLTPSNQFVSEFIGTTNIIPCQVINPNLVEVDGSTFQIKANGISSGSASLSVRPEHISIVSTGEESGIEGRLSNISFLGQTVRLSIHTFRDLHIEADIPTANWLNTSMEKGALLSWIVQPNLATVFSDSKGRS